jgi:hypothetical protein
VAFDRRVQRRGDRLGEREVHLGDRRREDVAIVVRPLLAAPLMKHRQIRDVQVDRRRNHAEIMPTRVASLLRETDRGPLR